MEIIPSNLFAVNTWATLEERSNRKDLKVAFDDAMQSYDQVDIEDAMKKLTLVGSFLEFAYASASGFKCQKQILQILHSYQSLIKDTYVVASAFVKASLEALDQHNLALFMVTNGKPDVAIQIMGVCGEIAGRMVTESEKLITLAAVLIDKAGLALDATKDDENATVEQRKNIADMIKEAEINRIALDAQVERLNDAIEKESKAELEAAESAKSSEDATTALLATGAASIITGGPGGVAVGAGLGIIGAVKGLQGASARKRQSEAATQRRNLESQKRQMNAEIKISMERISSKRKEDITLVDAISTLCMVIKTLGKINTIFNNIKLFWSCVKKQCEFLSANPVQMFNGILSAENKALNEMFVQLIKWNGFSWLVLGNVNRKAALAMKEANAKIDDIMNDLPTQKEAYDILKRITPTVIEGINKETEKMKLKAEIEEAD